MALEALAFPFPPVSPDNDDGGQAYNMGLKFTLLASELCHGVQWEVPDTVSVPPGGTHSAAIWTVVGETRIAYVEFTPVPNTLQDILFAAPVALTAGDEYVVGLYTVHYSFSNPVPGSGWVLESPSLNVVSDESRLAAYNGGAASAPFPSSNFNGWYYVSPLVDAPAVPVSPVPDGVPIPVTLGTPTVGGASTPVPDGLAVPVTLGTPSVGDASTPVPDGLAVPVTLGTPSVGDASSPVPDGLPIPVTLGTPGVGPTIPNLHLPPMTGTATVTSGLAGGAGVLTLTGTATIQ